MGHPGHNRGCPDAGPPAVGDVGFHSATPGGVAGLDGIPWPSGPPASGRFVFVSAQASGPATGPIRQPVRDRIRAALKALLGR